MRRNFGRLAAAVALSISAAACSGAGDTPQTAQQPTTGLPQGHPPIAGQAGSATQGPGGVVLETMDAGGYTYVHLGAGNQEIWVAGPVTALKVGDTVSLSNPMPMGRFTSQALERTFDDLFFTDAFNAPGTTPAAATAPAGVPQGVVAETMNSGGYTYVRIDTDGKQMWLAGPETTLGAGDSVTWSGGMVMRDFTSSSLDRTFEEIVFVNAFTVIG